MNPLRDLPRNTRNCLAVEPLWALFGGVIFYYAPLYQRALGLSDVEMGLLNSFGLGFSFLFFLLAGPLTNKFGRRVTSLLWDLFSWTISMTLWAFAQDFWWFFAAVFFNSAIRVTMVSWNLLVSEDAREDQKTRVFAIVNLLGTLGGIVSLVAGLVIDAAGIIPTLRFTYAAGAISMTCMFIVRFFLTQETENGRIQREKAKGRSLMSLITEQGRHLAKATRERSFVALTILFLLLTVVGSFTFFQIVYLKDELQYSTTDLAGVPAVNSIVTIILLVLILPRVPRQAERWGVAVGFGLSALAALGFLFLGPGSAAIMWVVQGLGAGALILATTFRDSLFMNQVSPDTRAELFGLVNMLAMLLSIPSGWLAGWLYSLNPIAPFVALVGIFLAGGAATFYLMTTDDHQREASQYQ